MWKITEKQEVISHYTTTTRHVMPFNSRITYIEQSKGWIMVIFCLFHVYPQSVPQFPSYHCHVACVNVYKYFVTGNWNFIDRYFSWNLNWIFQLHFTNSTRPKTCRNIQSQFTYLLVVLTYADIFQNSEVFFRFIDSKCFQQQHEIGTTCCLNNQPHSE